MPEPLFGFVLIPLLGLVLVHRHGKRVRQPLFRGSELLFACLFATGGRSGAQLSAGQFGSPLPDMAPGHS